MADRIHLAARFVSRAGRDKEHVLRLGPALQRVLDDAHRAWPAVELADEDFVDHLVTRLRPEDDVAALPSLLHVADLYLACAADRGLSSAVQSFEKGLLCRVSQFIDHINRTPAFVADVTQELRVRLFVGRDGQGKLSQYSGRGALESWLCIVAIRVAYDLGRARGHEVHEPDRAIDVLTASDDPELDLLRQRYDGQFRTALETALANLGTRERTVLRLYYIEQLTAAQIGRLYRVHEVTVLRWIARTRRMVLDWVRSDLSSTLGLSIEEFNDLLMLMRSRLNVSVGRLLETQSERTPALRRDAYDGPAHDEQLE